MRRDAGEEAAVMENIAADLIAASLVVLFLCFYAVKIAPVPLRIISGGVSS